MGLPSAPLSLLPGPRGHALLLGQSPLGSALAQFPAHCQKPLQRSQLEPSKAGTYWAKTHMHMGWGWGSVCSHLCAKFLPYICLCAPPLRPSRPSFLLPPTPKLKSIPPKVHLSLGDCTFSDVGNNLHPRSSSPSRGDDGSLLGGVAGRG